MLESSALSTQRMPVILIHDGGVDDFLALLLLLTMDHVDLLGIVVTPADTYIAPAVSATRKILDLAGFSNVPVLASTVRGVNPFPRMFRRDAFSVDSFPILNEREAIQAPLLSMPGQRWLAETLLASEHPVTVLDTGPLTTLAVALEQSPELAQKIARIVWMGGALDVPGNIDKIIEGGQDGTAEWNVYWDPFAAYAVFHSGIPLVMCPLDITNHVPITPEFVKKLSRQRRFVFSDLAGLCYALVTHQDYYAWDVLTTAYVGAPALFTLREVEVEIVTEGPGQGRTQRMPGAPRVQALDSVDLERFYAYLFRQWSR